MVWSYGFDIMYGCSSFGLFTSFERDDRISIIQAVPVIHGFDIVAWRIVESDRVYKIILIHILWALCCFLLQVHETLPIDKIISLQITRYLSFHIT